MLDIQRIKTVIDELEAAKRGLDDDESHPDGWHRDMLNKALIPLRVLLLDTKRSMP